MRLAPRRLLASRSPPDRPHPLARAPLVDRLNRWLESAWSRGWLPPPELGPDALWQAAAKRFGSDAAKFERAGRNTEDVDDFRLRLERLTNSLQAEADLNPLGRIMAWGQLTRAIKTRLGMGAAWARRPDLAAAAIAAPIIVIGHMRSGTTRIHKLFAADPAHSATRYCDATHPVPRRPDLRRAMGALDLVLMRRINPWLDAIHPMASGAVEEELGWLGAALNHSIYQTQWRIPAYSQFSEARDPAPVYREFARMLRTDAAHRGLADRPRVLKVPTFSEDLATLLATFPDARLVIAGRGREDVLRSAVSLAANQMAIQCNDCDLQWIEHEWRRKIALREERMGAALAGWGGPIARLDFDALNSDWEAAIAQAYAELGIELTDRARAAMQREMDASAHGQHRAHARQIARFSA